jgi:hypothetical protein
LAAFPVPEKFNEAVSARYSPNRLAENRATHTPATPAISDCFVLVIAKAIFGFTQFVSLILTGPWALAAFAGKQLHLPRLLLQYPQKITGECDLVDTSVPGCRPLGGRERDSSSATGPVHARNYIVERIAPFAHLFELRLKAGNLGIGWQKLYLDRQVERHRGCLFLGTNDTGTSHQRFFSA